MMPQSVLVGFYPYLSITYLYTALLDTLKHSHYGARDFRG